MKREILYQKIAGTIAWQIKTGIWKAGEKLPSLRTISNEYGVSLNTAIRYIMNWKRKDLSSPAPNQGTLSIINH
ncbi:GntR family transcriptional regulator [Bacteroides sp. CR5/BHMF/2]|nr:GntR family transcriptional regulator [Bacteroides sp. CR5/BHMF/2]